MAKYIVETPGHRHYFETLAEAHRLVQHLRTLDTHEGVTMMLYRVDGDREDPFMRVKVPRKPPRKPRKKRPPKPKNAWEALLSDRFGVG